MVADSPYCKPPPRPGYTPERLYLVSRISDGLKAHVDVCIMGSVVVQWSKHALPYSRAMAHAVASVLSINTENKNNMVIEEAE